MTLSVLGARDLRIQFARMSGRAFVLLWLGSTALAQTELRDLESPRCHWQAYFTMSTILERCYPEATGIRSALDEVIERLEGFLMDDESMTWRELAQVRHGVRLRLTDGPVSICIRPEAHAVFIHLQIQGVAAIRQWAATPPAMTSLPPLPADCH